MKEERAVAVVAESSSNRIRALLQCLGLERVHVAACMSGDWGCLVTDHADCIHSLTLVAPHLNKGTPEGLDKFLAPTLIIAGDQGAPATRARELADKFRDGELYELGHYTSPMWADTVADRVEDVATALREFLTRVDPGLVVTPVDLQPDGGEIAEIRYDIRGVGPPLVLLPLSMAPSQWEPLVSRISDRYCTITLGGLHLGAVALLEARGSSGYGELVARVFDLAELKPGETVLEVGCGTGALVRALARRTGQKNAIIATDINRYLLSEARHLADREGLARTIRFEEADGAELPYADDEFDVVISCTVLEEGQADTMVSELARVTNPGGRLVAMTRAVDVNWYVHLPVPDEFGAKLNALGPSTGAGVGEGGCADASLYGLLSKLGFSPRLMGPLFAIYKDGERLDAVLERLRGMVLPSEVQLYRDAVRGASEDGTLFVGEPFHCFVGTKMG